MTVLQQIELFKDADAIVGPQGSGFVNSFWAKDNVKLFKIITMPFNFTGVISFNVLKRNFYVIACKFSPEGNGRHFRLDASVIVPKIKEKIIQF